MTWRSRVREAAVRRLPPGSPQRTWARAALSVYRELGSAAAVSRDHLAVARRTARAAVDYSEWVRQHDATPQALRAQRAAGRAMPALSVLVVLAGEGDVVASRRSVDEQSWPAAGVVELPSGGSLRKVLLASDADFVVVLAAGDRLAPDALYETALAVHRDPLVHVVHWDDDVLGADGVRRDPRFRPAWSPETLIGAQYLDRSFAVRRSAALAAGVTTADRTAMWELLLRLDLPDERVARVSRVLRHATGRDDAVSPADVAMLRQVLGERGDVEVVAVGPVARVRWSPSQWPHVSVVVPTRHNRTNLGRLLPSLAGTDYPSFDVRVVDNGGRSADNERWYERHAGALDLTVDWWDEQPFNYSRVNNAGARATRGEVLLLLNDDTEVLDPQWLRELVGWATRPGIGLVGVQMTDGEGLVQHGGVVVGMGGFADHLFQGLPPHSDTLLGPTDWYRDVLAVTGACVAVRREVFDQVGGFDERFQLTGSDVVLGLDAVLAGLRNVCVPFATVSHLESATRGTSAIPRGDFFASYWRYSPWLYGGDPYTSPSLSPMSRVPVLAAPGDRVPMEIVGDVLGRRFTAYRSSADDDEARLLAEMCRAVPADVDAVRALHARNAEPFEVRSVNWYVPDIDSPFYGGINTALRIADLLARRHGVRNRFVVWGSPPDDFVRSALAAAFPSLADAEIAFHDGSEASLRSVPGADVAVATLWVTAYAVAHAHDVRRKFYLVQDYEPVFYPASTLYALTEETYRLGLYGLCNTENLRDIYADEYGGTAWSFTPAVDRAVFHAEGRAERGPDDPVTVFVYGRPGHWRNCWELASAALREVKHRLGPRVRIVAAGSRHVGFDPDIRHLGLLDYRATGPLYRRCDVGLALQVSKHPSYLPLELMACGVPVVAFDNPYGHWVLHDGENSRLAMRTAGAIADQLERLVVDAEERRRLAAGALVTIDEGHSDWDAALAGAYDYLCDPEGRRR